MSFELNMNYTKEMTILLSLVASIVFNESTGVEKLQSLNLLIRHEKWGEC